MANIDEDFLISALAVTEPLVSLLDSDQKPRNSRLNEQHYIELSIIVHYIRYSACQGLHYRCLETWLLLLVKYCRITELGRQLPYLHKLVYANNGVRLNSRLLQSSFHFQRQIDQWLNHRADRSAVNTCALREDQAPDDWNFIFRRPPAPVNIIPTSGDTFSWVLQLTCYEDEDVTDISDPRALSITRDQAREWKRSMVQDLVVPGGVPHGRVPARKVLQSFVFTNNGVMAYRERQVRRSETIGESTSIPQWEYASLERPSQRDQQNLLQSEPKPATEDPQSFFKDVEARAAEEFRKQEEKVRGAMLKSRQSRPLFVPNPLPTTTRRIKLESTWQRRLREPFKESSQDKPLELASKDLQEAFVFSGAQVVSLHRAGPNKKGTEYISLLLSQVVDGKTVYARVSRTNFNNVANNTQVEAAKTCPQTFEGFHTAVESALAILDPSLTKKGEVTCMVVKRMQITAKSLSEKLSFDLKDTVAGAFTNETDRKTIREVFDQTKRDRRAERRETGKDVKYSSWKYCGDGGDLMGHGTAVLLRRAAATERPAASNSNQN